MNNTIRIALPEIKPYISVKDNKVFSQYELLYEILSLLPTFEKKLIGLDYRLGTKNETGHYNGIIGKLQNDEVDLIFYPLPMDMSDPPGILTKAFFESSTFIVSLIKSPFDKHNDIFSSLFNLNLEIIILFLFFLFFLSVFTSKILKLFLGFFEALFYLLCLTFKKNVIVNNKFRVFFYTMLLYNFILITLFESNVNSNLVVKVKTNIIDTLDDLYEKVDFFPVFIKDHFTLNHFKNPCSNKKLKSIYQRAVDCNECIQTIEELMNLFIIQRNISFEKKTYILDQTAIQLFKNVVCTIHHEKINSFGSLHTSSFIFKNQFGYLMNKKISKKHRKEINSRMTKILESGVIIKIFENVDNLSPLGKKEYNLSQAKCSKGNKTIERKYQKIKLSNIILLSKLFFILNLNYFFIFISLNYLKHKLLKLF